MHFFAYNHYAAISYRKVFRVFFLVITNTYVAWYITIRHRNNVECLKFEHIENCSKALGILREELISKTKLPGKISVLDAFNPTKTNTSLTCFKNAYSCTYFFINVLYLVFYFESCKLFTTPDQYCGGLNDNSRNN